MDLNVDIARTTAELDRLAQFSDVPTPAVQRVVFTPTDLPARPYLTDLSAEAGLLRFMSAIDEVADSPANDAN